MSVSLGHTPISTLTSNLALVACLKEEDRDVREGVRMKTKIELAERKKKKVYVDLHAVTHQPPT